ncbi:hypothetical protein ACSS6W_003987 [Trichoderma asperelloides]
MSIFSSSPMALDTISDMAVRQITEILYIDSDSYWDAGAERWLSRQKTKVGQLTNTELLRSKPALFQKARKASLRQQGAILCSAHEALDPRVIRSLLWNIAYECTAETNKYRVLRIKGRLEVNLTEKELEQIDKQNCELNKWMDWINEISVLWLGEKKYRQLCRPTKTVYLPECVKTRCEACMLATVGGSIPYLTALRASLLARQAYKTMKSKGKKAAPPPSLLRVIDSWISLIQGEAKRSINIYSDEFVHLLVEMRVLARSLEDEQIGRRQRRGSPPLPDWGAGMVSWTKDGLPEPLKDRPRKRPVRRDTTMWTTERAQSHGETTCEDSSSSSSSSVKMRGGVQTEVDSDDGEAGDEDELLGGNGYHGTDDRDVFEFEENGNEEGFLYGGGYDGADERVMFALEEAGNEERSPVRDSHNRIDWAQEVRRIDVKSTATLVSLYDCYRRLPGDHWLSNVQPSGSVFPFTVDPQESTSSWTSGVVDDDTDIYDDDDDDDDGRLVEMETMSYSDGNAVKSADNENTETEVTTPAHHEDGGSSAPPETSSVYSCDIQDKDDTHNGNNDATVAMENPFDVGLRPLSRYERVSAVPAPLERIDATRNAMKEISETGENNKKEGEETDKKAEDEEDRRREKLRDEALAKLEGRRYDGKGEQQGAGKKRRRSETSATLQDRRLEEEKERPTLVKSSEGGDRAASCFESMGWGGPRK